MTPGHAALGHNPELGLFRAADRRPKDGSPD
jgi:hypothetical protein